MTFFFRRFGFLTLVPALILMTGLSCSRMEKSEIYLPKIEGEWWQIAGSPDLGSYTSEHQQPVDFGIWQAKDGTWQLWSCIRQTRSGGTGRLLYRWEGKNLPDAFWEPQEIAMEADTTLSETKGGLQAPFVIKEDDTYYMFYGDWRRICLATSKDGKTFTRIQNANGEPALFSGPYTQTRDPMILKSNNHFYSYYTDHLPAEAEEKRKGAIFGRTSTDLLHWSEPVMVSAGGIATSRTDWYAGDVECPFVVELNGLYYLFRNQVYGEHALNTQYASPDPLYFGVDDDQYLISTLPIAAPEIIEYDSEYYLASLMPNLKGIRLARLKWERSN